MPANRSKYDANRPRSGKHRPGARVTVRASEAEVARWDECARRNGITRTEWILWHLRGGADVELGT